MTDRIESEKEFHNHVFEGENDARTRANEKYYVITQSILDQYSDFLKKHCVGKRVMEYGCGLSNFCYFTVHHGAAHATAIDISDSAIEQAARRATAEGIADRMEFLVMDAEQLTFPDGSFDVIFGNGIIHHLNVDRAYSELARAIKEDGHVVFTEPLGHNPFINLFRKLTPNIRTKDEHPLVAPDIKLAKHYFERVEASYFYCFTLMAIPFRKYSFFHRLVKILNDMDKIFFRLLPFTRRYAWMVMFVLSKPRKA
ncbi:MAG: class SAM-dependent methyltransferase [Paenibacillus sp.]|jgi:SAM-dependent methyltransferase|nr:class SAM-dependent methyltransferase [Paenibacillus sp.]